MDADDLMKIDQSCQNVECEDITSQSEEKGTSFQNVQPDEPKTLNECVRQASSYRLYNF